MEINKIFEIVNRAEIILKKEMDHLYFLVINDAPEEFKEYSKDIIHHLNIRLSQYRKFAKEIEEKL